MNVPIPLGIWELLRTRMSALRFGSCPGALRTTRPTIPIAKILVGFLLLTLSAISASAADTFNWSTNQNRVTADVQSGNLSTVLGRIVAATGWQIYIEPGTTHTVSAKFKNLPPGEALRLLLGELNFALVPETNGPSKLFVFRTIRQNATELVRAPKADGTRVKVIPNELIVTLKPGASIDALAKLLGAKVLGRLPGRNTYRLQFDDADATDAARKQLTDNPDVVSVDNNYSIDRPQLAREAFPPSPGPPHLQLTPPPDNGRVVVGLIDTAVQPLGNGLDSFLLKAISVAGDPQTNPNEPTHGTSMAETILRSLEMATKGSTSVQILPVDVYGQNATTSTFEVAAGIAQAINGGANVINLSLGSEGDSPFLRDLIKDAIQKKIAFFAAAGNQPVTTPFYPAAYSDLGVNAVTATSQGQLAPYANRGQFVTAAAPGTSLFYYNGQSWVAVGTSTAAAIATGMAAGYMDSTHSSVDKMQSYINSTLGVKLGSKP